MKNKSVAYANGSHYKILCVLYERGQATLWYRKGKFNWGWTQNCNDSNSYMELRRSLDMETVTCRAIYGRLRPYLRLLT